MTSHEMSVALRDGTVMALPDDAHEWLRARVFVAKDTGCWRWRLGTHSRDGGPLTRWAGVSTTPVRVACFLLTGEWPRGHMRRAASCHGDCIRPDHHRDTRRRTTALSVEQENTAA